MLRKVLKDKVFIIGEIPLGNIDGLNIIFQTSTQFDLTSLKVYLNGLALREGPLNDFIIINSTTFEFVEAPEIGDVVEVDYQKK